MPQLISTTTPQPLLEVQRISFSYASRPLALNDVSVRVYKGERVAVLGGNGAGKSTFFLNCNGVLTPGSGKIFYKGKEISRKADLKILHQNVGLVFQEADRQFIAPTLESDISFGPVNLGLSPARVQERVEEALKALGLEELRRLPPHYLSGGEKRKAAIAGVLAMQPEVILFDEPTASLDHRNLLMLQNILDQLHKQGLALLIATHDVDFVWGWAKRVLLFHEGRLLADATPQDLFSQTQLLEETGLRPPYLLQS